MREYAQHFMGNLIFEGSGQTENERVDTTIAILFWYGYLLDVYSRRICYVGVP